jgi:hypothetical protein
MIVNKRPYVIALIASYMETIPYEEEAYRTFLLNQMIRLGPQPTNEDGRSKKYEFIPNTVHISVLPKFWKKYQHFLVNEYKYGYHPEEVDEYLDKLINKSYLKIGKIYDRVNKHYKSISDYKKSLTF